MSKQVTLRMSAGTTYICPALPKESYARGDTVTVNEDIARMLEQDMYLDALNNEHKYWVRVPGATVDAEADDSGAGDDDGEEEDKAAVGTEADAQPASKAPARARTARKTAEK